MKISFSRGINVFFGNNAQGKTNLLEAIRLAGTTRSHRLAHDTDMILFGEKEAHLRLSLYRNGARRRIDLHLRRNGPKGIAIDGLPIRKASELMGTLHTCLFSPEDLAIIKSGPKERRRFLDSELCQLSGQYLAELSAYNKAVLQRNALLKEKGWRGEMTALLDAWDEQLLRHGNPLIAARQKFIDELAEIVTDIHKAITGGSEDLKLIYEPNAKEERLQEQLSANRDRDLTMRATTTGPHRDDIGVQVNGIDLRRFGSQGQQRTAALSMKLAEIELARRRIGDTPILLLDDVFSELDINRQTMLLEKIADTQTFITCTGIEGALTGRLPGATVYQVTGGKLEQKDSPQVPVFEKEENNTKKRKK